MSSDLSSETAVKEEALAKVGQPAPPDSTIHYPEPNFPIKVLALSYAKESIAAMFISTLSSEQHHNLIHP